MFDDITRFIFDKKHFSVDKGTVKSRAFRPDASGKTSVSGISGIDDEEIWNIGNLVSNVSGRQLRARGDISASSVRDSGLNVVSDGVGHPRHANIEGWPLEKQEMISISQELAAAAILTVHPMTQ